MNTPSVMCLDIWSPFFCCCCRSVVRRSVVGSFSVIHPETSGNVRTAGENSSTREAQRIQEEQKAGSVNAQSAG